MLQTARYLVREAVIAFLRARSSNALTVGIISASFVILGGFLLLWVNLKALSADWNRVQVNAYLTDEAVDKREAEVRALVASIRARPFVADVRQVTREEALSIFKARFAGLAAATDLLAANPLPASLEISTRGERNERLPATAALLEELKSSPLVETVQDNEEEAQRLMAMLAVVSGVGFSIGAVLALASVFIVFNVIRLTVSARRDEISIMRLVGATGGFIRGPLLVEGMLQGGLGAGLALAALYFGHMALADYAARSGSALAAALGAHFLPISGCLALAGGGLLVGLTGSALSVRRFLTD